MALLFNIMLAVALLCSGSGITAARAQMHTESFELIDATLLGSDHADAEVASVVHGAVDEMKGQGAEVVEVTLPVWQIC